MVAEVEWPLYRFPHCNIDQLYSGWIRRARHGSTCHKEIGILYPCKCIQASTTDLRN